MQVQLKLGNTSNRPGKKSDGSGRTNARASESSSAAAARRVQKKKPVSRATRSTTPVRRRPTRREISEEEYDEEEHVPTPTPSCRVTRSKRAEPLKSTDAHLASSPAGVEKGATVSADNVPDVDPGEGTDDAVVASDYVKPVSQKPRVVEVIDGEEEHVPNSLKDDVEDSDAAEVEACTPTATGSGTKSCRPARSSDLDKDVEVEIEAREPARKKRRKNSRTTPPDALDPPHNSAPLVDGKLESTQDRREENYDIFAADTRKGRAAPETRKNHAEMDTRKQLAEERSDRGRGESNTERRLLMMEDHFKEMFRCMKGFEKNLMKLRRSKILWTQSTSASMRSRKKL